MGANVLLTPAASVRDALRAAVLSSAPRARGASAPDVSLQPPPLPSRRAALEPRPGARSTVQLAPVQAPAEPEGCEERAPARVAAPAEVEQRAGQGQLRVAVPVELAAEEREWQGQLARARARLDAEDREWRARLTRAKSQAQSDPVRPAQAPEAARRADEPAVARTVALGAHDPVRSQAPESDAQSAAETEAEEREWRALRARVREVEDSARTQVRAERPAWVADGWPARGACPRVERGQAPVVVYWP